MFSFLGAQRTHGLHDAVVACYPWVVTTLLMTAPLPLGSDALWQSSAIENYPIHTIPLQLQTVPVIKNNVTISSRSIYYGQIAVGSPRPQVFDVVFDTGSGNILLPDSICPSDSCQKHKRYDSNASETAVDVESDGTPLAPGAKTRQTLEISYGSGETNGQFMSDKVCLWPAGDTCVVQMFIAADRMSVEPFSALAADGIVGLGMEPLTLNPKLNFLAQLKAQHPTMLPRFAIFLARDGDQSTLSFGGHDERRAASELQWTPVAAPEEGYWQVQLKGVRIGDTIVDDCSGAGCRAIMDSGSSHLRAPLELAKRMSSLLARPAPGGEQSEISAIDCSTVPGPMLYYDFEGFTVSMPAEGYTRPRPFNLTRNDTAAGWELSCRSSIMYKDYSFLPGPRGQRVFIWGKAMLQRYYTVYDWGARKVGLAIAREASTEKEVWTTGTTGAAEVV